MSVLLVGVVIAACSLVHADHKCVCNVNHPTLTIYKCPAPTSKVIGLMYPGDANNQLHGIVDTPQTTCKPMSFKVKTSTDWVAVDHAGKVGFIRNDAGIRKIICSGDYTEPNDTMIPDCHDPLHTVPQATTPPTTTRTMTSTTITSGAPLTSRSTTMMVTTTKAPTFPVCSDDLILGLVLHEAVEFNGAGLCPDGSPSSSEAPVMKYCGAPGEPNRTAGLKVVDHCSTIPHFTPVGVFINGLYMGKPVIFHSCRTGALELIRQACGSPMAIDNERRLVDYYYVLTWP